MDAKEIQRRTIELNKKNFPSEVWFEKKLIAAKIFGYHRNPCLIKRFFGDFVWRMPKIVVEIDGKSHNGKQEYDKARDALLAANGYKVLRIRHGDSVRASAVISMLPSMISGSYKPHKVRKKPKLSKAERKKLRQKNALAIADNRAKLRELKAKEKQAEAIRRLSIPAPTKPGEYIAATNKKVIIRRKQE